MRRLSSYLEAYSVPESLDLMREMARIIVESDDFPLSYRDKCMAALQKADYMYLCTLDPEFTLSVAEYAAVRQVQAIFGKAEFLDIGIDRRQVAVKAFLEAEEHCWHTNQLFRAVREGRACFLNRELDGVLMRASQIVARLLGPAPKLSDMRFRYGPGATTVTPKRQASAKRKLGMGVSCSTELSGMAHALLSEMPALADLHATYKVDDGEGCTWTVPVEIHTGAVSFVPKNYKTDRTTETQPTLNGMLQLALGDLMSRRLSRVEGLDLSDQTLNQRLARIGSLTGALATLDLKSASNCISVELVRALVPEDWYGWLIRARVGRTRVPSFATIDLEMFSGMGNGFTFPLQSVIFYALSRVTADNCGLTEPIVSVFGDDIIVDTEVFAPLCKCLRDCGLWPNEAKSFAAGPFRESCGTDFLWGIDVRPAYIKKLLSPAVLFAFHNTLKRKGGNKRLLRFIVDQIHPDVVLFGPDGYGDGHLVVTSDDNNFGSYLRPYRRHLGYEGFTFRTYQQTPKRDWTYHPGDTILPFYSIYIRGEEKVIDEEPLQRDVLSIGMRSQGGAILPFLRAFAIGHGVAVDGNPIPFGTDDSSWGPVLVDDVGLGVQGLAKAPTFPGVDSYTKVTIYTLA